MKRKSHPFAPKPLLTKREGSLSPDPLSACPPPKGRVASRRIAKGGRRLMPQGSLSAWTIVLLLMMLLLQYGAASAQVLDDLGGNCFCRHTSCEWTRGKLRKRASYIGIGHTDILDTYISQEKATGPELRYIYTSESRKLKSNEQQAGGGLSHVSHSITHQIFVSCSDTRGNDYSMLSGMYNLKFGWHYNWDFTFSSQSLNLKAGGLADGTLGFLYNTRNSNNPAQARASLSIDPSVIATWSFKIKNRPFAMHYEVAMPLAGIAFSPNYGQSYYEIFSRGNYDHNVVFTSPFSGTQLHQLLAFDFRLWRTTFTIGYLGDIRQMDANNLKYHQYTHSILIGWRY